MTNYSRSVLKSNGLPRPKIRLKKFDFSSKTVPTNIAKKLPLQRCFKPLLIELFNFSHKRPTFAFTSESGYTLGFQSGNVKKCAVGKHPKSEKHGNTAQFSEVERSGTQENCGGIESGCLLRLHPLPVPRRRQPKRVACIDPDAVVVDKNIAKNDRFDLFSR